jgi:DivIVA domain-containing protein
MPFAPHEIENKKFVTALRGYQTDEVEAFLRAVAADYRNLLDKLSGTTPEHWVAEIERVMSAVREEAEREADEIRTGAEAEATALREATQQEAEACFAEIARQAQELQHLKTALWTRIHALEHTVVEARQTLAHLGEVFPMPTQTAAEANGKASVTV